MGRLASLAQNPLVTVPVLELWAIIGWATLVHGTKKQKKLGRNGPGDSRTFRRSAVQNESGKLTNEARLSEMR